MAGEGTKRIIDLTEAAETQSGDYIAIDSTGRGTRKLPAGFMATAEDLSEEQTARQTADATLDGKITAEAQARLDADNALGDQITALDEKTEADAALIQNPTKTLSGTLVSFTDGADMPMVACTAEIIPKQSGSGTPSPDNVRPISGWESVNVDVTGENVINPSNYLVNNGGNLSPAIGSTPNYGGSGASASGENPVVVTISTGWKGITLFSDELKAGIAIHLSLKLTANTTNTQISYYLMDGDNKVTTTPRVFYAQSAERTITDTITPTKNGERLAICVTSAVADSASLRDLVVSYGDTDYEPYIAPNTTTTSLGRTVYGGTLDVVTGVLTVTNGYVDLGTLEWRYSDGIFSAQVPNFATPSSYSERKEGFISSVYSADIQITISANTMTDGRALRTDGRIYIKDTRYTDAIAFKSAVSGQQLVYELAEPQTYQLTPTQINTLLGENNVWADSGDVEITYRRDISIVINNLESALNG